MKLWHIKGEDMSLLHMMVADLVERARVTGLPATGEVCVGNKTLEYPVRAYPDSSTDELLSACVRHWQETVLQQITFVRVKK